MFSVCQSKNYLIFFSFFFAFAFYGVDTDLFVILLKGGQILTSFGEFTFFHTFTDVPMDESSLGVHKIELMIKTSPCLSNGGGVAQHAHGTLYLGKITTWYNSRWLVVDTDFETSWAPIDKLNGTLGFDGCNGCVDILGDNISTVQHTTSHVFSMTRITFDHLVGRLEAGIGDFRN